MFSKLPGSIPISVLRALRTWLTSPGWIVPLWIWKPLPKVVFSTTLSEVQGNARLASGSLAEEIELLRAEPAEGEIAIGGATLAAEAAEQDLIDEYRAMVHPVLVGGGIPFFPRRERREDLELVETRTFSSKIVYLRYRVVR